MDLFGTPNIQKMADERDINGLYLLLEHRNKMVRLEAAQALAGLNDGAGWRLLMDTVKRGEDPEMREIAAAMLGELGHPRAVPVLAEVLRLARSKPVDERLVQAARESLEVIGGTEAEEALRDTGYDLEEAIQNPEVSDFDAEFVKPILPRTDLVQFLTAEQHLNNAVELREAEQSEFGLVECSLALWLKPDWAYAWYLRGVLMEDLDRAYEATLAYQQALALDTSQAGAREALDDLEEELHPSEPDLNLLSQAMGNFDWQVRRDAAAGIGALGDPRGIDTLIPLLQDEEREVRHAALEALNLLSAHDNDRRALLPILETDEQSWLLRFTVIQALATLSSVDGLVTVLRKEMDRLQERNPVFTSHKDPLVEVEYDRLLEIGVLALERTGDVAGLLEFAEANTWEEMEDEETGEETSGLLDEEDDFDALAEDEDDGEAEEDLSSYVDEVAQLVVIALERLATARLPGLSADLLRRLAVVPDLTLLDLEDEESEAVEPTVVYDLSALREAAARQLAQKR